MYTSNLTITKDTTIYELFKGHHRNIVKFMSELSTTDIIHNRIIVTAKSVVSGEEEVEKCNFPHMYMAEGVVYFRYGVNHNNSPEHVGLDFRSFKCDFYTFNRFVNIWKYMKLHGAECMELPAVCDLNSFERTSRVVRELSSMFDLQYFYQELYDAQ